jgi:hypothetical protein
MAGQDELNRGLTDGLDDIEILFPRDAKNPIHALVLECSDEQIRSFEHELPPD